MNANMSGSALRSTIAKLSNEDRSAEIGTRKGQVQGAQERRARLQKAADKKMADARRAQRAAEKEQKDLEAPLIKRNGDLNMDAWKADEEHIAELSRDASVHQADASGLETRVAEARDVADSGLDAMKDAIGTDKQNQKDVDEMRDLEDRARPVIA